MEVDTIVKETGEKYLKQLLKEQPDLILNEILEKYNKRFKPVSRATIDRTLKRLKITRKKKPHLTPEKTHLKTKKNNKITKKKSLYLVQKI